MLSSPFLPCTVLIRRSWLDCVGGFDPEMLFCQDWDCWLRLSRAGCQMSWLEQIVACYRVHAGNKGRQDGRIRAQYIRKVLDNFFSDPDLSREVADFRDKAYAMAYIRGAWREYATGHVTEARQDVARAAELCPDLLGGDAIQAVDLLLAWGGDPSISDRVAYGRVVLNNLPEELTHLEQFRSRALARQAISMLFEAYARKDFREVRLAFLEMMKNDPSWLLNRGVLSILLESVLGGRALRHARRVSHFILGHLGIA